MNLKVTVLFLGLCLMKAIRGDVEESRVRPKEVLPKKSPESTNESSQTGNELTILRNWKPWRLMKLEMYYVDSQRTITRRDSSLVVSRRSGFEEERTDYETLSTARNPSTVPLTSESGASLIRMRPKGSVQKEIVTMMFESMLDNIVDSWDVIIQPKSQEITPFEKTASELTFSGKKKKIKPTKSNKRSKLEMSDMEQTDSLRQSWWSAPDERAIVRFRNGNVYEGSISMKCMHGEGRFHWTDGTVYLGQFEDNQICGKGLIQWKDDTWYEGDFVGNLRHGKGLYVDSRKQRSYIGGWHCGTKHGQGIIYYSKNFKNSYDGDWEHNVRHGFGFREYCPQSGYKGQWDQYVREGTGFMIWPNHDFYKGEWKNGVMSGQGIYVWDACYNNTLSVPSISAYRGQWVKGQRNGYGVLNLGFGLGSHYKGNFKNNKKHGLGKFVTNNGLILHNRNLFIDDNIGPLKEEQENVFDSQECRRMVLEEPYEFDLCDSSIGYLYHVHEVIKNIDKQIDIRKNIINNYLMKNKTVEVDITLAMCKEDQQYEQSTNINLEELITFEEISLRKSLRCYETDLKNIYLNYATICNNEDIQFTPVLIRLFLWQMYYDCNIHDKGLTLIEIDRIFHRYPQWLSKRPHNPFEKIYFWQFIHSMITVASKLYAKRELPGPKPDTILASAFRSFMEIDILPNVSSRKGFLVDAYGQYVPLKGLYAVYCDLNEPHTVRNFLCAIRRPPHCTDRPQPSLVELSDECLPLGHNVYIFGDNMTFVTDGTMNLNFEGINNKATEDLKLFNFGNLSSKSVIKIFSKIFPQLCESNKIMNLDIEITFFEFFQAFIACAEESIRIKEEEIRWREKFYASTCAIQSPNLPIGQTKINK